MLAIVDIGVNARDTVGPDRAAEATQVHDLLDDELAREAGEEAESDGVDARIIVSRKDTSRPLPLAV